MSRFPKTAVPAARSSAPVLAIRRRILFGLLLFAAAAGVMASCSVLTAAPPVAPRVDSAASPAVALATQVARDFLNATPTVVPVANDVDPNLGFGSDSKAFSWSDLTLAGTSSTTFAGGSGQLDQVRFFVQLAVPGKDSQGGSITVKKYYQLVVPMSLSATTYPRLAEQPTLMPMTTADGANVPGIPVSGFGPSRDGSAVSGEVRKVVGDWARAFAAGGQDDANLKRITGDPSTVNTYTGLGGWALQSQSVDGILAAPGVDQPGYVVRTTLVLSPPAGTGPVVKSTYDVWVAQTSADQANPPVVAWAPAGSYSSLKPYMNAIVKH